jgi:hypothetical protein
MMDEFQLSIYDLLETKLNVSGMPNVIKKSLSGKEAKK